MTTHEYATVRFARIRSAEYYSKLEGNSTQPATTRAAAHTTTTSWISGKGDDALGFFCDTAICGI